LLKLLLDDKRYTLFDLDKKWHKNTLFHLLTNGKDTLSLALSYKNVIEALNTCVEEYNFRV